MVDVKRVTASVKKVALYTDQTGSVTNEVINFAPSDNPPNTYTIDPFAIFTQEAGALKVKIPFSRFYRLKYAISITDAIPPSPPPPPASQNTIDQFSISKPILVCTENLIIERTSYNGTTEIQSNVYNQDGSGFIAYDPVMIGSNITSYTVRKTLTPGIVEGIVELYAGDVLTFKHSRTIYKESKVTGIFGYNVILASPFNAPFPYSTPPDQGWAIADIPITTDFPAVVINDTAYKTSASFFFEISEITDL